MTKTSYPVKYMIVKSWLSYRVIDTSLEGNGQIVCCTKYYCQAAVITKLLNESEGFRYDSMAG